MAMNSASTINMTRVNPIYLNRLFREESEQNWELIAITDKEVRTLLAAGFRFYTNWSDPDQANNTEEAKKRKEELDKSLKKLKTDFGASGVCVIKSAYDTSGRCNKF